MLGAIREQLDTIFRRDPAARSVLEIILCYPGFHAVVFHRMAHRLYKMRVPILPRFKEPARPRTPEMPKPTGEGGP